MNMVRYDIIKLDVFFFFETLWLARRCWCAFPRLDQGARSDDISLWVYVSIPLTSFNMCMIICVHAVYSHEFSNMHVNYLHLYAYCIYDLYIYIFTHVHVNGIILDTAHYITCTVIFTCLNTMFLWFNVGSKMAEGFSVLPLSSDNFVPSVTRGLQRLPH